MENVLYADILFFVNFSMDFITLYLTSRLTSGPPAGVRSAIAAAVGGIYGTLAVAVGIDGIYGVIFAGAVSVVMVLISFGYGSISTLLRRAAVFWGGAALLGGVMTAICSFGNSLGAPGSTTGGTAILFAGSMICLLFIRVFTHFKRRRAVIVTACVGSKSTKFHALCDSGNLVTDPLSGNAVIIVDRSVASKVIPELYYVGSEVPDILKTRLRMIPVKGFGGDGILTGFVPDSITVTDGGKAKKCSAVIAVTDKGDRFFGGYPANIPITLV